MSTGTASGSDERAAPRSPATIPAPAGVSARAGLRAAWDRRTRAAGSTWPTLGLLVAATVVAIIVTVVTQLAAGRLLLPPPTASEVRRAVTTVAIVAVFIPLVASVLLVRTTRWRRAGTVLSWASLSALVTVLIAIPLGGSSLYLHGVSIDQEFRSQFLTRLTDSAALSDMNYAGLKSFYPAGWFWVGGRVGNLLGLAGWEVFKPYAIGSLAVAAVVAAVLWARLLRADHALLVAVASTVVAVRVGAPEPYGAMIALVLPPVLVLAWSGLRARPGAFGARAWRAPMVATGLFLGVAATFYTLYLGIAALTVVVMALLAAWLERRQHGSAAGARVLARLIPTGLISVVLALAVWAPYLLELLGGAKTTNAAQRYLPTNGAELSLPMTIPSLLGALCLIGTVWMLVRARTSAIAQALGIGVLCLYLWSVLSMLALLAHTTLLGFRLEVPLEILLAASGTLGVIDAAQTLAAMLRKRHAEQLIALSTAVTAVALACAFALTQAIPGDLSTDITSAYTDANAHGVRADGVSAADAAYYPHLDAAIAGQTHRADRDVVVLSTEYQLFSFYPYRGFQMITPHYANPLADFPDRAAEIARWAASPSSTDLLRQLDASPWQAPTAFVLLDRGDHYTVTLTRDTFPDNPNVQGFDVSFPKSLFADPAFTTTPVGPFAVVVRKS